MIKKDNLYYPTKEFQKNAWANSDKIYKNAQKEPIKFWEKAAEEIVWKKKWKKTFEHTPPYFKWFLGGKMNITESVLDKNLKNGDKTALIWEPEPIEEKPRIITYKELALEVNKFANALKKIGVKKGDRVGIYLPMIPEVVVSMLACARIGAVHSIVFSAFSPSALKIRLQDTKAKVLITADGYWRRGKVINLKANATEAIKETSVEKIITVKRTGVKICWNPIKDVWYEELIKNEKDFCEPEEMDAEDLLFILYTSGSTGKPKGVLHACGGYTVQAKETGKLIFDIHEKDIIWCTSDVGWITGHSYTIYSPLLNGATTIIFEGAPNWPATDRWAKIIEKHKATIFYTAPTAIRMFKKYGAEVIKNYNFESLRLLGSVGEPIDESSWLWYFKEVGKEKCPIVDTWWQTETGGILITSLPGIGPFKPSFSGIPFPPIKVDILDNDGKTCLKNEEGNLVILPPFSPGMLRGVYNNPQKYLKTYWANYGKNIYFTSDAALKDENGLVRVLGRVDDVIKVAGHRMSTGALENAINHIPGIAESAVVGIPDEIKGEVPIAFINQKGQKSVEELKIEIISQIRKEIGPIALPKEIYLVEDLPKTRSGKIMRRILRKLFTGEDLGDLSTLANSESVEEIKKTISK
ncbi:acetate--CoA ligase [Patescibacteria group bacterium]